MEGFEYSDEPRKPRRRPRKKSPEEPGGVGPQAVIEVASATPRRNITFPAGLKRRIGRLIERMPTLVDGAAIRSCVTPVSSVANQKITTIEGLATAGRLHPVQVAWIEEDVPQCGYCQAGQIMLAVSLLSVRPEPTDVEIQDTMSNNLCRCGTYLRIRRALKRAASMIVKDTP
jgi:hypothetical protein